jgi:hypothetical protein
MTNFARALRDIDTIVGNAIRKKKTPEGEYGYYWDSTCYDEGYCVVRKDGRLFKMSYTINGDAVELGEAVEVEEQHKAVTPPAQFSDEYIEREAKLFEAGSYEDKGVEVTEADLDNIAANTGEVPLKVEHSESPFDGALGSLAKVWRTGKDLMGRLRISKDAWGLLESTGIKSLSVGLLKDKSALAEVSLTKSPRVADAQVFHDSTLIAFSADVSWVERPADSQDTKTDPNQPIQADIPPIKEVKTTMSQETKTEISFEEALRIVRDTASTNEAARALLTAQEENIAFAKASQNELIETARKQKELNEHLRTSNAEQLIAKFKNQGRLTPAMEPYARALFAHLPLVPALAEAKDVIKFKMKDDAEEESLHWATLVHRMLSAAPEFIPFGERVRNGEEDASTLTPEQEEFARRMGVLDLAKAHA